MMKVDAKEKLKRIGQAWLSRGGIRSLKIRPICEEAGVSPGTFTSHYRTLREFKEIILSEWYEPLRESVERESLAHGSSLEVLKAELRASIGFICRNSAVLVQLYMDAAAGEKSVIALFQETRLTHLAHIRRAVTENGDFPEKITVNLSVNKNESDTNFNYQLSGFSGVNNYSAQAFLDKGKITVANVITTMMAGDEKASSIETEYLQILSKGGKFSFETTDGNTNFIIRNKEDKTVLVFREIKLENTAWNLTFYNDGNAVVSEVATTSRKNV